MPFDSPNDLLTPALVAALHAAVGSLCGKQWTVQPLAGGITNVNYRIDVPGADDGDAAASFVLRVAGAGTERLGIDRQREFAAAKAAAECGAGCEVIAYLPEHRALVVRYAPGKALAARDLEDAALLARSVAALRLFHAGSDVPGEFHALATVQQYLQLARAGGVAVPREVDTFVARLEAMQARSAATELRPCHNDLLPANLIDDGQRVRLIDWEYAAMGDPWFDLGNLAENNELSETAERRLLELYFGEVRVEDTSRLRHMRFASAMREAAWGFAQVAISTLEFDFEAYARKHVERAKKLSGGELTS